MELSKDGTIVYVQLVAACLLPEYLCQLLHVNYGKCWHVLFDKAQYVNIFSNIFLREDWGFKEPSKFSDRFIKQFLVADTVTFVASSAKLLRLDHLISQIADVLVKLADSDGVSLHFTEECSDVIELLRLSLRFHLFSNVHGLSIFKHWQFGDH